jgi:proline iminopeptidase
MCAQFNQSDPIEGYVQVANGKLFYRAVGQGRPIILLHGGPDFDQTYLLPDMDRLSDAYRLIYYDQRGRGKSAGETQPDEVSIKTEIEDLEALRDYFQLDSVAVLGHSWGGILAMEYAIRHPNRVSHMILMNTAPASHQGYMLLRQEIGKRLAVHQEKLNTLRSSAKYAEGDPETVAEYYRIRFSTTIKQPEHLESLIENMRASFSNEGVLKAREIEDQLYEETVLSSEFDLTPKLKQLSTPTLIIHGDYDFIPVECISSITQAIPNAHFTLLKESGHFAYLESPDDVRTEIAAFFASV